MESETRSHSRLEMLRQLQALRLVIRAYAFAVELRRPRDHLLIDQAPDDLPMHGQSMVRVTYENVWRALGLGLDNWMYRLGRKEHPEPRPPVHRPADQSLVHLRE